MHYSYGYSPARRLFYRTVVRPIENLFAPKWVREYRKFRL